MRNINEFNIPAGNSYGYEILYFAKRMMMMTVIIIEILKLNYTTAEVE
jgi:hypothetical protein